jgi:hypothetical protein
MYLFYHIKYSHRQLIEKLKDITDEQYYGCLLMEHKLREFIKNENYRNDHFSLSDTNTALDQNQYIESYNNNNQFKKVTLTQTHVQIPLAAPIPNDL